MNSRECLAEAERLLKVSADYEVQYRAAYTYQAQVWIELAKVRMGQ